MLFRSGWNAKQVQMVLGHHSPAFTLATYVHLVPDDLPEPNFREDPSEVDAPRAEAEGGERFERREASPKSQVGVHPGPGDQHREPPSVG